TGHSCVGEPPGSNAPDLSHSHPREDTPKAAVPSIRGDELTRSRPDTGKSMAKRCFNASISRDRLFKSRFKNGVGRRPTLGARCYYAQTTARFNLLMRVSR